MTGVRPRGQLAVAAGMLCALLMACGGQSGQESAGSPAPLRPSPSKAPRIAGGINAEPSMRPFQYSGPNPDGWWCQPPNCYQNRDPMQTIERELDLAARLGVANVRLEFPWYLIQPARDRFDWSRADAIVAAAKARNVNLQPVLVYSPPWAAKSPVSAPRAVDFAGFVTAIVTRYHRSIRYWEMWNEPDLGGYWSAGEATYVSDIVVPGYRAARDADPAAQVILAGQSAWSSTWFEGIFDNGGGQSFDIVAYHDYRFQQTKTAVEIRSAEAAHQGTWPIWLGEYGAQEASASDSIQIKLMEDVLNSAAPIAVAQWYNLRDDYAMTCCPPKIAVAGNWGLVMHDDATMKNGFVAMQALLAGTAPP